MTDTERRTGSPVGPLIEVQAILASVGPHFLTSTSHRVVASREGIIKVISLQTMMGEDQRGLGEIMVPKESMQEKGIIYQLLRKSSG